MKKSKHSKAVIEAARFASRWIYKQTIDLEKHDLIGICLMIPMPREVYDAILRIEDDAMPNLRHDLEKVAAESIRLYLLGRVQAHAASVVAAGTETVQ